MSQKPIDFYFSDQLELHDSGDPHRKGSVLSEVILGGQDGLVNVLGIVLGVAAATGDPGVVIVAGLAATFAESISMAAVAYTSTNAETARYESEKEREYRHIHLVPSVEREEVREIYRSKGFNGELLEQIVEKITADQDVWVGVMMAEEHQLIPLDKGSALRAAVVVGVAAIIGSLIPLFPFLIFSIANSIWLSLLISALTLFVVGAYKARVTVGNPGKSGLEMAIIGSVSALVGYAIGLILK